MKKLVLVGLLLCIASLAPAVTLSWKANIVKAGTQIASSYGVAIIYGACENMNGSTFTSLLGGRDPQNEWSQYTVKNPDDGFAVAVKEEKTYAYSNKIASLNGVFDTGSNTSVTFVVFNWLTLDQNGALTMVTVDNLSENATVDLGTIARKDTLTHTTISVMPVPEPTVFALLALGVAGFALRRKL